MFFWPSKPSSYTVLPKFRFLPFHRHARPCRVCASASLRLCLRLRLFLSPFSEHDKIVSGCGCLETFLEEGCSASGRGGKVSKGSNLSSHSDPTACGSEPHFRAQRAMPLRILASFPLDAYPIVGSWVTRRLYFRGLAFP